MGHYISAWHGGGNSRTGSVIQTIKLNRQDTKAPRQNHARKSRDLGADHLWLKIQPWGGGYKTPVFDSVARGFVTVTGGTHLRFLHVGHFVAV